ncbi:MAG: UDP-N-acetylmuramoyl-L-alanine--D-glutamate ligase [Candidatus Pacebacteria bacterium]|nr:UDP-N-acetylmuramoyl-L-alanine--D-glutamate ligase [Candidatus Paceibacterota bacterium]
MQEINKFIKGKKVLVVGLGILGGGVSTCLWLLKHKAKISITDLKQKKDLEKSLKRLKRYLPQIKLVLGKHNKNDFQNNDIIVVNPGVPVKDNPYLKIANQANKFIENEITLFFRFNKNPVIAVTGSWGKTTTTNWISHLLRRKYRNTVVGGNTPDNPALSFLDKLKPSIPVILELSSFQLELLKPKYKTPKIAVITNLYRDHLNRHCNMKDYARAKARIFQNQKDTDYLILNYDNEWTKFFLRLKPVGQVYFVSHNPLPENKNGIYSKKGKIYFQENKKKKIILNANKFIKQWGRHNLDNLMSAILAAKLFGLFFSQIKKQIATLPKLKFRQEIVFQNKKFLIINDSSATSPDATIAALKRFRQYESINKKNSNIILIIGGTDKDLEFNKLAEEIKQSVLPKNLVILNGSASKELIKELNKTNYSNKYFVFESLAECFYYSLCQEKQRRKNIILFSPAATSFEKFKNEYDRAEKFNKLVKRSKL